jgi:hypothetical protein
VVSVIATGPKGRGIQPRRWEFKGDKSPQQISLADDHTCKVKFSRISSIPPTCSQMTLLVEFPESSGGRVRSFSQRHHHYGSLCSYITRGMNNRSVGGSGSEIQSHTIDMINESIITPCRHKWSGGLSPRILNLGSRWR